MNNDSFLIEEFDLDNAKNICKLIENPELRNKAVANVAAANFAKKYFEDYAVDTETGVHNICQILEELDISDIYIKDNYIDVRLYFNDNELFVPKAHFDNNLLPVAYMFIKVSEELSNGLVTGFITPSSINTDSEFNGYYHINEDELISFYDIESSLVNKYEEDLPDNFESLIFDYLDNKLTDKISFYRTLLDSKEARLKLQKASKAKIVFNFVSIPEADEIEEETDEIISQTEELLEVDDNTDFSLGGAVLEEFEVIEESDTLALDETNDFSFADYDTMALDFEEEITPFEEISLSNPLEEDDDDDAKVIDNNFEEETVEQYDAENIGFSNDFDTDSIQMLDAGAYEEQPLPDFAENIQEEISTDNDDEITINMIDSSKLDFDNPIVFDEEPTFEEINKEEEEENSTLDIIEEPEFEEISVEETAMEEEQDSDFDFSTAVTPSIDTLENEQQDEIITELTEDSLEYVVEPETAEQVEQENSEQIDTLFQQEDAITPVGAPKSKSLLIPIVGVIAILAIVGYYSYTKFIVPQQSGNDIGDNTQNAIQTPEPTDSVLPVEDAMPVETVENVKVQLNTNEGNAVSIPAIEQNLDASITVSNLRVEFEIPAGYKASKTAERYFTKMGKIIQLNLKTELLLLTKQPITNKIAVELEYNKGTKQFDVKGILASSGEPTIDDLILKTVKKALSISLNMNMGVFGNVSGNPVLVIKL